LRHHRFRELPSLLHLGDLLVVNNTRVFPAKLQGKTESGGVVDMLLVETDGSGRWEVLARPAKKLRMGTVVRFGDGELQARVTRVGELGRRTVELLHEGDLEPILERLGRTPLPPYIKREPPDVGNGVREREDRDRYQTVYARERGSVAAPTAGLHFTRGILDELKTRGIDVVELTLHVGYGTFQPIRTETVEAHRMEAERYTIPPEVSASVERTRDRGGRVVAVGTTTVRALESAAVEPGKVRVGPGVTELFIHPGFQFRVVDALLTNFHLPRSSLLMLVSALGGVEAVREAYREAVRERYRFYSYGDCMLVY
jgi:S-adenosylmethionine:tRNA ribosyltransferase-isomerase